MTTTDSQELTFGMTVKARRDALGLTQRDVYAKGGPSPATLIRWEHGHNHNSPARAKALSKLDHALDWTPGTARALYNGDLSAQEALHNSSSSHPPATRHPDYDPLDPAHLIEEYGQRLITFVNNLMLNDMLPDDVKAEARQLQSQLVRANILHQLQTGQQDQLEKIFAPLRYANTVLVLSAADQPKPGSTECERWSYINWRTGGWVPPKDAARFRQREDEQMASRSTGYTA